MKNTLGVTVCALSLLMFASSAQSGGVEASGDFDFGLAGATGTVVFDAVVNNAGEVRGGMTFTATVDVGDPGGSGDPVPTNVAITAQWDCVLGHDGRAAMSGVITSSTVPEYVGQRTTLVVEENVPGISPSTDAFVWGVYQPMDPTVYTRLVSAQDHEYCRSADEDTSTGDPEGGGEILAVGDRVTPCDTDPGTSLTWVASDYELCPAANEDNPNPTCATDPGAFTTGLSTTPSGVDCESFPLSSYPLNLIPHGGGNKVNVMVNS